MPHPDGLGLAGAKRFKVLPSIYISNPKYIPAMIDGLKAVIDDDDQLEIILNTGHIVDSKFLTLESAHIGSGAFGLKMRLLDVNGDGYPEIIGETALFALKIYDIYAQRIDVDGVTRWAIDGVAVCNAPGDQVSAAVHPDGAGGVIVAWEDFRQLTVS